MPESASASSQASLITAALIDVETTGLSPYKDEIIEIAICLFEIERAQGLVHRIVDVYTGLREPARLIPTMATAVHGIRNKDVRGKRLDMERIAAIINQADVLIAHNATFDSGFVTRLFPIAANKRWLCSMRHIPWLNYGVTSRSLGDLLALHGLVNERAHRAQGDVMATLKLLSTTNSEGRTYLSDLLSHKDKAAREQAVGK